MNIVEIYSPVLTVVLLINSMIDSNHISHVLYNNVMI